MCNMSHTEESALEIKDLYKSFKLPHERANGLKQLLVNFFKRKSGYETQHVLDDVSFEVKKGEFFGIVGRNGSGKSTLLKLLSGIYHPDSGTVKVNGSLTPFIELGVGFNPELTGRENVYMNGALLGFDHQQMSAMYDDIVEFAELERFMDQKLKNYSSGMQVRLAFSIAIRADTDILVLDEVLAVGDAAFQQKCYSYFNDLKKHKKTVILVTHDMSAVSRFCDRALYIDKGKISLIGSTREVADRYLEDNYNEIALASKDDHGTAQKPRATVEKVVVHDSMIDVGESIKTSIYYENPEATPIHFGFQLFGHDGNYSFGTNTRIDGHEAVSSTKGKIDITIKADLIPGMYFVAVATMDEYASSSLDYRTNVAKIIIRKTTEAGGVAYLDHKWETS